MADTELLHRSILENTVFSFARSGGKGGQNVNKVNTKVHATVPPEKLAGLTDAERSLLTARLKGNLNAAGELFIDVDDERYQERNREIAVARLEAKILAAVKIPKKRKKTKPTKASQEKRLLKKKLRSQLKSGRHRVRLDP